MFLSGLFFPSDAKPNCVHSATFFPSHQTVPEIRKVQNAIGLSAGKASHRDHIKNCFIHYSEQGEAKLPGNLECGHNSASSLFGGFCRIWVYINTSLNGIKYVYTVSTESCISSRQFRFNFYFFYFTKCILIFNNKILEEIRYNETTMLLAFKEFPKHEKLTFIVTKAD